MLSRKLSPYGFIALTLLLAVDSSGQAEDGTWVNVNAEDSVKVEETVPRLGEGSYLDYSDEEFAADSLATDDENSAAEYYFLYGDSLGLDNMDDIFLPPPLEFEGRRLQDILLEQRLPEEENFSLIDIFRQDSTMAISLMQLRDAEYPHYHLLSNLWVYVWRGRGQLIVEDREIEYGPGQFYQIPAGIFHSFKNVSGAPTVCLVWQRPSIVDSLVVEVVPEEVLEQMRLDSLRLQNLQDRTIYKSR
ncbi:MAG: cupin domain-containing protein [bacterium]|nr:cupin domain-containing protein [bacterium]